MIKKAKQDDLLNPINSSTHSKAAPHEKATSHLGSERCYPVYVEACKITASVGGKEDFFLEK